MYIHEAKQSSLNAVTYQSVLLGNCAWSDDLCDELISA